MYKTKSLRPLVQSLGIISAVMVLVSGVTFAALQSQQAVLKGNTIQTAMADLKISTDGTNYSNSLAGYSFANMIPGGGATPTGIDPIYLMNNGSTSLAVKLSIGSGMTSTDGIDLTKVHLTLTPDTGGVPQSMTLHDLVAANVTGGIPITVGAGSSLAPGAKAFYAVRIVMDIDAISGPSATISNLDLDFDATAVN